MCLTDQNVKHLKHMFNYNNKSSLTTTHFRPNQHLHLSPRPETLISPDQALVTVDQFRLIQTRDDRMKGENEKSSLTDVMCWTSPLWLKVKLQMEEVTDWSCSGEMIHPHLSSQVQVFDLELREQGGTGLKKTPGGTIGAHQRLTLEDSGLFSACYHSNIDLDLQLRVYSVY